MAVVGETITLPCRTTLTTPVDWSFVPLGSRPGSFVCSAGNILNGYSRRMTLDRSAAGDFSLVVHNVTREDAGLYICTEDAGLGLKHRIRLTVQGTVNILLIFDSASA